MVLESYQMFQDLLARIDYHLARRIFRVEIQPQLTTMPEQVLETRGEMFLPSQATEQMSSPTISAPKPIVSGQPRPGRNDPCPCGSGKKYKKCCYPKYG